MCGIISLISTNPEVKNKFAHGTKALEHRGPDKSSTRAFVLNSGNSILMGHTRLSILDLSEAGTQPLSIKHREDVGHIVFNGEIYNYKDVKKAIVSDFASISTGDTEVLLQALIDQGPKVLAQLNGMWAFAAYLEKSQELIISRDRLGKKPLYIYESEETFAVASELKSFAQLGLKLTVCNESMSYYRWLGYIPAELTIYKECRKLKAASYEVYDTSGKLPRLKEAMNFWDPLVGYGREYRGSYQSAIEEFFHLLDDAVRIRLNADVPIGLFLSGGVDSSLVLSSLAAQKVTDITCFTVGHSDPTYDESQTARESAQALGIPIKVLKLDAEDFARQVRKVGYHFDEPFSDSSQIATLAISEKAREFVKVVLTGDGGDEVFLGYPRYKLPQKFLKLKRIVALFPGLKSILKASLGGQQGMSITKSLTKVFGFSAAHIDYKVDRLLQILSSPNESSALYDVIMAIQPRGNSFPLPSANLHDLCRSWYPEYAWDKLSDRSEPERFAGIDLVSYLKDDVLVKVDRSTMAYGLEARSPLLDYRIIEFGTSLPYSYKYRDNQFKAILRDALQLRLPGQLSRLPKRGFGVPLTASLPPGRNVFARWNSYIEDQWGQSIAPFKNVVQSG